jgi:SAM-dependent methyltransferase
LIKNLPLHGRRIVDLGCGYGTLLQALKGTGANLIAVDVAEQAIQRCPDTIKSIRDCIPYTLLDDDSFDLVICTELIAELPEELYRLFFMEISRLVKRDGYVILSTPIDIRSEDALGRFTSLAETEFNVLDCTLSRHAYHIRINDFFKTPMRRLQNGGRKWLWTPLALLFSPIVKLLQHSRIFLLQLEKLASFFSPETSISHSILMCKRRPLYNEEED